MCSKLCLLTIMIAVARALVLSHIRFSCFTGPIRNMVLQHRTQNETNSNRNVRTNTPTLPAQPEGSIKFPRHHVEGLFEDVKTAGGNKTFKMLLLLLSRNCELISDHLIIN